MKLKYSYTLFSLILALNIVPAVAQTNHKAKKKPAVKSIKKKTVKTGTVSQQKAIAKSLGDEITKTPVDTTKKGTNVNSGNLSEEIIVTTAYKPVLADAVKIRHNPDLDDVAPFKAPLTYFPLDKRLELNTDIKPIVAMKRPAERDSDLTNNYLKIGLGNLKTTYGEAYFNNGRDQALQLGGYLKHFAQDGNVYKQNSSKEEAGIFLKSIGEVNSFRAQIDYNYSTNYFYGFSQAPSPQQVGQQHFSTIGGELEFAKNYKDVTNDFTYAIKLKGYAFNNAFQAKENNVVLSGFLNETVKQFYAGLAGSLDLSTQQDSLYDHNNSLARVNPYLKFQGESYKIDAGLNIVDQFGYTSAFYVFPAAKLELQVIPKYVRLFAQASGDVNKTSIRDFSLINPFIGQNVLLKNSVDQLDLSAGLKGTLLVGLGFKAFIYHDKIKDLPLLVSNFNFAKAYNRFNVIYDSGSTVVNGFKGELDYKASASLDIFGTIEFKDYHMASLAQPWNLPKFKLTASTVLHISDKVDISGSLLLRGTALDPYPEATGSTQPTTISSFADLSGGFQYKASKQFVVFVNVNNILNTNNQTWLFYPEYGFNIFGGVGFSF